MNIAIVFAEVVGVRMSADVPKLVLALHGKPVLAYALALLKTRAAKGARA